MAVYDEVVLRLRVCVRSECRAVFFLCSHCDRGHRYCSLACRQLARLKQRRGANRRHQQSPEGRLDHRDRQREYRRRRGQPGSRASVTDQGSLSIACPASFVCGPVPKPGNALFSRWPETPPGPGTEITRWLRCQICGRIGRFIDPFPRLPRRR